MDIRVLDANPLYMNQVFRLSFIFSESYPIGMCPISMTSAWRSNGACVETMLTSGSVSLPETRSPRSCLYLRSAIEQHTIVATSPNPFLLLYLCFTAPVSRTSATTSALPRPSHPDPPAHLQQRHHLPGPARHSRLVARPERRERVHEHPEHVDWQYQERAAPGRRTVLPEHGRPRA